ncbi:MAG: MoaD family protein [Nitrososphaerota archaeon]
MSPRVKVTVTAVLANYLGGQRDFILEADSVKDVIEELAKKYGSEIRRRLLDEEGRLRRYINIYVNDRGLSHQELNLKLKEGDEVLILPAVSGGLV